ncbi:familial paroxysmal dyskinesia/FPD1 [Blumeria hordei DH14]|uniref:Familial paroxysmal dyskinesia/FPD1 n=1 Tax=Blumeria graminis f. sp. hordei (strain DH14) TaxID=546991 RepID=N1JER9_BLUG1|nr:familial paroxysmal dyskinesia/FPD1 [Blumeria hordei DH14]
MPAPILGVVGKRITTSTSRHTYILKLFCRTIVPRRRLHAETNTTVAGYAEFQKSRLHSSDENLNLNSNQTRARLHHLLLELQKHASSYVNQSKLQLVLRGLEQIAGSETIRILIAGIGNKPDILQKTRNLVRLLVADPLKPEEEWEKILLADNARPVMLKIGAHVPNQFFNDNGLIQELFVSSSALNGCGLEIILLKSELAIPELDDGNFLDALLVPNMNIPTSRTGRQSQVTMPVHRTLIVSEGLLGMAMTLKFSTNVDNNIIATAVDLKVPDVQKSTVPCYFFDISSADHVLKTCRNIANGSLLCGKPWLTSGIPQIQEWLVRNTSPTKALMKPPLKNYIELLVQDVATAIESEQIRYLSTASTSTLSPEVTARLQQDLEKWKFLGHSELQEQLEIAFNGRRWHKLKWWKLFWRVDDVSMIASEIINQRFLNTAEHDTIFLAGRFQEHGILRGSEVMSLDSWAKNIEVRKEPEAKLGSSPRSAQIKDFVPMPEDTSIPKFRECSWPQGIPATRLYLLQRTVPALQSLAQRLVIQTLSLSSFATALGSLMYLSSWSVGIYEAGAVTALFVVVSLRKMQGKWEAARKYWEKEVYEEGRKALRSVEGQFHADLSVKPVVPVNEELTKAKSIIQAIRATLASCT